LPREELGIGWQARRVPPQASIAQTARLPGYPLSPRAKRSVGVYISQ